MRSSTPIIGHPIALPTPFGELQVKYVRASDKEGVIITRDGEFTNPVPVRIQSSCLFSESLLAINCDCAAQLHASLEIIAKGGLLTYLYEEGRGAGLETKIQAIRIMKERHCDTAEAYRLLNLDPDLRNYEAAASIVLEVLGKDREITMITNNPGKVNAFLAHDLRIVNRMPLICRINDEVDRYLAEKSRVLGHRLDHD